MLQAVLFERLQVSTPPHHLQDIHRIPPLASFIHPTPKLNPVRRTRGGSHVLVY
jgi:hypothetical protein